LPNATAGLLGVAHLGKAALKSGSVVTPGQVDSFGVPRILKILKS
jgi:hypothetical protein